MKRAASWVGSLVALALAGVCFAAAQAGPLSQEVLVTQAGVLLPAVTGQKAIEVQNLGPNPIFCTLGGSTDGGAPNYPDGGTVLASGKARRIEALIAGAPPDSWAIELTEFTPVRCLAGTADQVTGAATIVTIVKR